MSGNSKDTGRSVTSKIAAILATFTAGGEHSVTEIGRRADLPISTAYRLSAELASWGMFEKTAEGRYRTGPELQAIGTVDFNSEPSLIACAPDVLNDLSAVTNTRSRLGVLRDSDIAFIERIPVPQPVPGSPEPRPCLPIWQSRPAAWHANCAAIPGCHDDRRSPAGSLPCQIKNPARKVEIDIDGLRNRVIGCRCR
jgi:predicted transcriptional regulator